jgi:hypothetical protein
MIAVEKQDPVEVYLASEGSIVIAQEDSDLGTQLVAVRVENVDGIIRALRVVKREARGRRHDATAARGNNEGASPDS